MQKIFMDLIIETERKRLEQEFQKKYRYAEVYVPMQAPEKSPNTVVDNDVKYEL